jgi:hypothetical protein
MTLIGAVIGAVMGAADGWTSCFSSGSGFDEIATKIEAPLAESAARVGGELCGDGNRVGPGRAAFGATG